MTTPHKAPLTKRPVRRVSRRRYRFRRVVAVLLALFATEVMWRTGAFAHVSSHVRARPVAAARYRHAGSAHPRSVGAAPAVQPAAPVGPPVATAQAARSELDRLISLGQPVCRGA